MDELKISYKAIPLFHGLNRVELAQLVPSLAEVTFAPGEAVFRQGEGGSSLFIIVEGEVSVQRCENGESPRQVAVLRSGDCFGEIALLTGAQRSADVIARSELRLLKISRGRFEHLIKHHPSISRYFADLLARRIYPYGQEAPLPAPVLFRHQPIRTQPSEIISRGIFAPLRIARSHRGVALAGTAAASLLAFLALQFFGVEPVHGALLVFLFGATVLWSLDIFNYHAIALALPVLLAITGVAPAKTAFSGFASTSWFLVLGVFALSAAVSRTGLMYRMVLKCLRGIPPAFGFQAIAMAVAGLVLTPVIPSSNGRATLAGPLVQAVSDALRLRPGSRGAVGLSMAALLGFGHMSFMFMNGTATCLFALGLLPAEVAGTVSWGRWFVAVLVLGITMFVVSISAILVLYRPRRISTVGTLVLDAQIFTLGPITRAEKITMGTIVVTLAAFLSQSWHGVNPAWIAMGSCLVLFMSGVLDEKSVRSDIDWNFLLSFGALIGFAAVISGSGLSAVIARASAPAMALVANSPYLFLPMVATAMHLVRFVLPLPAAILVILLTVLPMLPALGIHPLVVALVVLAAGNPWFFPYQNSVYLNLVQSCEDGFIRHPVTLRMAWWHVAAVTIGVFVSIPYWRMLGLVA
jgi:di/tricarboxylate transporter